MMNIYSLAYPALGLLEIIVGMIVMFSTAPQMKLHQRLKWHSLVLLFFGIGYLSLGFTHLMYMNQKYSELAFYVGDAALAIAGLIMCMTYKVKHV